MSTVEAVPMGSQEETSTASLAGAIIAEPFNFSITVDLVILQNSQLGLLALVLDFLGGIVNLLLPLLTATTQSEN